MTGRLQVRANGSANAQVTDRVKSAISRWLRDRGVSGADREVTESTVLYTHCSEGNYVAITDLGADAVKFGEARERAVESHPDNRTIHEGCFWVAREWIAQLSELEDSNGHEPGEE